MFNSGNLETSIDTVKVDDVSEVTMKILQHYFYTHELLPFWCDEDNIVEFTYAAGKYQLAHVLELLDDHLGMEVDGDIGNRHVQLLSLAAKWCLKKAEMRLLQQVKDKVKIVEGSGEVFKLFSIEFCCKSETGWGNGENLQEGNEDKYDERKSLKLFDYAIRNLEGHEFNSRDLQVWGLVEKYCLKNVENILVQRFKEKVNKVESAEELFAIFEQGK